MARRDKHMRMSLDEAERIAAHAEAGRLDESDESVREIVGDANARVQRALVWGAREDGSRRRTMLVAVLILVAAVVAATALLVPLAIAASSG